MSRNRTALASVAVAAGLGAWPVALAAPPAAATAHTRAQMRPEAHAAAGAATISLRKTHLGMILVNSRGLTVYAFGKDAKRQDRCVGIQTCTTFWPLVRTSGRPRAGKGVKRSLLGTIKVGNATQVTYAGHPLYTYTGDGGIKGSTAYVGVRQFGGVWRALRASGATVK